MNSIVLINRVENMTTLYLCSFLTVFLILTFRNLGNGTVFSVYLTVSIFIYSTLLTYLMYIISKRNTEYQNHKLFGPYVPSFKFDKKIRSIELSRGMTVERFPVMYTRVHKYAERLLADIINNDKNPTIDYDYKDDSYTYSVNTNGILITGKTGSREMAICIMYVEIFG